MIWFGCREAQLTAAPWHFFGLAAKMRCPWGKLDYYWSLEPPFFILMELHFYKNHVFYFWPLLFCSTYNHSPNFDMKLLKKHNVRLIDPQNLHVSKRFRFKYSFGSKIQKIKIKLVKQLKNKNKEKKLTQKKKKRLEQK